MIERFSVDFTVEFQLCREFLKLDQRNFHCWNYRRQVARIAKATPQSEFNFSGDKIGENFSNYSAFHHRSVFLFKLPDFNYDSVIESELQVVENAVFTEPDDQSAWWYLQFLLASFRQKVRENQASMSLFKQILVKQIELIESLLELEDKCKLAMTALVDTIGFLLDVEDSNDDNSVYRQRRVSLIHTLSEIDPMHINRYRYLLSQHAA